jgi:hypothetical protein
MLDDSNKTKAQLLDKIKRLHEQIEQDRKSAAETLERTVSEIKISKGIIPICSYCKATPNNEGEWEEIEVYIMRHSNVQFSHGVCPKCYIQVRKEAGL